MSSVPLIFFVTGVANIFLIKWADNLESMGSDGVYRRFQHPLVQTSVMFFGQFLCFIIYKIAFAILRSKRDGSEDVHFLTAGGREFSLKIFLLPALCDVLATSMFLYGIYLSYASSSQVLRGTAVIFIGLFSNNILNLTLKSHQWLGMLTISLGAFLVCVADIDNANTEMKDSKAVLTGDLLIICAQIIQALQLVYEEKYVKVLNVPALQAVGWEGILGLIAMFILQIPFNFLKIGSPFGNNARGVVEDLPDAMYQLFNNYQLLLVHGLFMVSVVFYNYTGITITKNACSVNRILLSNLGVVAIWILAMSMAWEKFHILGLIGYLVLLIGIFIYKNNVCIQFYRWTRRINQRGQMSEVINEPADAI